MVKYYSSKQRLGNGGEPERLEVEKLLLQSCDLRRFHVTRDHDIVFYAFHSFLVESKRMLTNAGYIYVPRMCNNNLETGLGASLVARNE